MWSDTDGVTFSNFVPNLEKKSVSILPECPSSFLHNNQQYPALTTVERQRTKLSHSPLNRHISISADQPYSSLIPDHQTIFSPLLIDSSLPPDQLRPHSHFPIFEQTVGIFQEVSKKTYDPYVTLASYNQRSLDSENDAIAVVGVPSLQQKAAATFSLWSGGILPKSEALQMPSSIFRQIVLKAFQIHWHVVLHPEYDLPPTCCPAAQPLLHSTEAADVIFTHLSNPYIFYKLHCEDKRLLMYIVNYLQFRDKNKRTRRTYDQLCRRALCQELLSAQEDTAALQKLLGIAVCMAAFFCELSHHDGVELLSRWVVVNCKSLPRDQALRMRYEATAVLLRSLNSFNRYEETFKSYFTRDVTGLFWELDSAGVELCRASLHAEQALFHYAMSEYWRAFESCCSAAEELHKAPHPRVVLQVLRVACKLATLKRQYELAMRIAQFSVAYAHDFFGDLCLPFATTLIEYGCVLLSADHTKPAKKVYKQAERIIRCLLPGKSVLLALAFEDLSYSSYVLEYSTGNFERGSQLAWTAVEHLRDLGHSQSLQCASVERVAALIMEEMALDTQPGKERQSKLDQAENLHQKSLKKCKEIFGEVNVQTAKHYGNLGRLYQSMRRMEHAEWNHLKAIEIKEKLLGVEDFEVALSVGHLASLYNYDMKKFADAEKLYRRSIDINRKLYGPAYSGLEYDYRGLIKVYTEMGRETEAAHYRRVFDQWEELRVSREDAAPTSLHVDGGEAAAESLHRLLDEFRSSCVFRKPEGLPAGHHRPLGKDVLQSRPSGSAGHTD